MNKYKNILFVFAGALFLTGAALASAALQPTVPDDLDIIGQNPPASAGTTVAGAPSTPAQDPTGSNTVTPTFSGLNISGPIFNETAEDADAAARPIQIYDHANIWGDLNIGGGEIGSSLMDENVTLGKTVLAVTSALRLYDVLDTFGNQIINSLGNTISIGGDMSVLGKIFDPGGPVIIDDTVIINQSASVTAGFTAGGAINALGGLLLGGDQAIEDTADTRVDVNDGMTIQGNVSVKANAASTATGYVLADGNIRSYGMIAGDTVGTLYVKTASSAYATGTKSMLVTCDAKYSTQDTAISCNGYWGAVGVTAWGSNYILSVTQLQPIGTSPTGCFVAGNNSTAAAQLTAQAMCFSPDGG